MDDIQIIKTPKYIVYNGNLYELVDTNVPHVMDYDEALDIVRRDQNQCGYSQGRSDAINDFKKSVKEMIVDLDAIRFKDIEDIAELLKEQKNE